MLVCIFAIGKNRGVAPIQLAARNSPPGCFIQRIRTSYFDKKRSRLMATSFYGAGDEARTRYLHLGKVALYRMSYTRGTSDIITLFFHLSIPKKQKIPCETQGIFISVILLPVQLLGIRES